VERYQRARVHDGAQGRTVNMEMQVLRQILKANKCWRHLEGEFEALKERENIGRALSPEEECRLLAECAKAKPESAVYPAVVLALNTSMCSEEIKTIRWKQVNLFKGEVTVGKGKNEERTGRWIPLNAAAVKVLADWSKQFPNRQPEHYVSPWCESKQTDPSRPTMGWRTAWRNAL
jgi:integrase